MFSYRYLRVIWTLLRLLGLLVLSTEKVHCAIQYTCDVLQVVHIWEFRDLPSLSTYLLSLFKIGYLTTLPLWNVVIWKIYKCHNSLSQTSWENNGSIFSDTRFRDSVEAGTTHSEPRLGHYACVLCKSSIPYDSLSLHFANAYSI